MRPLVISVMLVASFCVIYIQSNYFFKELLQLQQRHHRNPFCKAREERADLHVGLELLHEGLFEPGAPVRKS